MHSSKQNAKSFLYSETWNFETLPELEMLKFAKFLLKKLVDIYNTRKIRRKWGDWVASTSQNSKLFSRKIQFSIDIST